MKVRMTEEKVLVQKRRERQMNWVIKEGFMMTHGVYSDMI